MYVLVSACATYRDDVAYHHVHCSGWHDWLQTFNIAHSAVELLCVSLYKTTFNNRNTREYVTGMTDHKGGLCLTWGITGKKSGKITALGGRCRMYPRKNWRKIAKFETLEHYKFGAYSKNF